MVHHSPRNRHWVFADLHQRVVGIVAVAAGVDTLAGCFGDHRLSRSHDPAVAGPSASVAGYYCWCCSAGEAVGEWHL